MNKIKTLSNLSFYDAIEISHLVYEQGDDGLMMACKITKNKKQYYTNLSISFSQFNYIVGKLLSLGIDVYDELATHLFNSNSIVSEVKLENITGKNIVFDNFSLVQYAA